MSNWETTGITNILKRCGPTGTAFRLNVQFEGKQHIFNLGSRRFPLGISEEGKLEYAKQTLAIIKEKIRKGSSIKDIKKQCKNKINIINETRKAKRINITNAIKNIINEPTATTHQIGDITETKMISKLIECGFTVSIPYGLHKYDIVIEKHNIFWSVQCKTGNYKNGIIKFNTAYNKGGERIDYVGKADLFAVYCSELDKYYLIFITDEIPKGAMSLRVDSAKHPNSNINWAKDYEI